MKSYESFPNIWHIVILFCNIAVSCFLELAIVSHWLHLKLSMCMSTSLSQGKGSFLGKLCGSMNQCTRNTVTWRHHLNSSIMWLSGARPMQALRTFSSMARCLDSAFTTGVPFGTWYRPHQNTPLTSVQTPLAVAATCFLGAWIVLPVGESPYAYCKKQVLSPMQPVESSNVWVRRHNDELQGLTRGDFVK